MESRLNDLKSKLMIQSKANNISSFVMESLSKMAMVMLLVSIAWSTFGQGWEKAFGGDSEDQGFAVLQTNDHGFLTVGWSESFGEDNDPDVYVIRTDVDGTVIWEKVFDDGLAGKSKAVIETADKGFLIAGELVSEVGDESVTYLLKITEEGKKEWSRTYGDPTIQSEARGICEAPGGGFFVIGNIKGENDKNDVVVMKVDDQGEEVWTKTFGNNQEDRGNAIVSWSDGIAIVGTTKDNEGTDNEAFVSRLDLEGNLVWTDTLLQTTLGEEGNDLLLTQSGELVVVGSIESFGKAFIAKYSVSGEQLWLRSADFEVGGDDVFYEITEDANEDLAAVGIAVGDFNADILLGKFDKDGNELWLKTIGDDEFIDSGEGVDALETGGYVIVGYNSADFFGFNNVFLIKTDVNGDIMTNYITGRVYSDEGDCDDFDPEDLPLEDWLVIAQGTEKSFLGTTDENGVYSIRVDTGLYEVNVLPVNSYWTECQEDGYQVNFEEFYDTTFQVNFSIIKDIECPYLEVDVSAEFLTICSDIDYTVAYCNLGTGPAEEAYVDLTIDEDLSVNSASLPFTQIGDSLYRFELGTIDPTVCGNFVINTALPCDGIATDQAGMVSAHIYPDSICSQPGPNWDGSSVIVSGACIENDSVRFKIENVGDGDMQDPIQYFIVEDDVIVFFSEPVEIEAGGSEFESFDSDGSTYRIVSEQSMDHPGMGFPTAVVEGCTEDGNYTTGYVTQFPENDQDPFVAIDVQEAIDIDSELPQVDLRGYPKGIYGNEVVANTDLTYILSFINTGNDTINRIVIRDTIPTELDITSVVPGSSSHPYDFEIYENGILKFTFNEIQLQPSGSAEATNRGFVKFRIAQKPDLSVGTKISNSAAVFFDYHDPLETKEVEHVVSCLESFTVEAVQNQEGDCIIVDIISDVDPDPNNPEGIKIKVHPNPFFESATIEIEGELYDDEITFELYDLYGRVIRRNYFKGQHIMFYRNHLPSGVYTFKLESEGQHIYTGRLVVR